MTAHPTPQESITRALAEHLKELLRGTYVSVSVIDLVESLLSGADIAVLAALEADGWQIERANRGQEWKAAES